MRVDCNTHFVLPLEGSREACNPHQAVYLIDVVYCSGKYRGIDHFLTVNSVR